MRQLLQRVLNAALPGVCVLCEMHGQHGRDLCEHCHEALPWNYQACARCAEPLPWAHSTCQQCPTDWPISQTVAPLLYAGAARRWVTGLKFQQGLVEGRLLGEILADAVVLAYPTHTTPQALVPMPLHWRRLMRRGLNQAQVIAGPTCRRLPIAAQLSRLKRRYQSVNQHELARAERLTHLTDSFYSKAWHGQHIALVDDVLTTGATASAAAQACLAAGASRVDLWCATRTPAPTNY